MYKLMEMFILLCFNKKCCPGETELSPLVSDEVTDGTW